ncbi:hypothetical protein BDV97DRAFT_145763 [Delphinella strobiligena]|nr:hypothetical protein BDV97DRAFT_145763 [Delphinella strobiligena]
MEQSASLCRLDVDEEDNDTAMMVSSPVPSHPITIDENDEDMDICSLASGESSPFLGDQMSTLSAAYTESSEPFESLPPSSPSLGEGYGVRSDAPVAESLANVAYVDIVLAAATEKISQLVRQSHNVLSNRTERSLYALADELWAEADDPAVEESSANYFAHEGDKAEEFGVKLARWLDISMRALIAAEGLCDQMRESFNKLTRRELEVDYESVQTLTNAQPHCETVDDCINDQGFTQLNQLHEALQEVLNDIRLSEREYGRLIQEITRRPEFRHIVPGRSDFKTDLLHVRTELEAYYEVKLERFLSKLERVATPSVMTAGQDNLCRICCCHLFMVPNTRDDVTIGLPSKDKDNGMGHSAGVVSVSCEGDGGYLVDVDCLRIWLQTSPKCPVTRRRLL